MGDDARLQPLQHMHPQVQVLQQAEQALESPLSPGGVKPMSIDPPFTVAAHMDEVQTADAGLQLAESMSIDSSHAAVQWLQQSRLGATAAAPGLAGTPQVQSAQAALPMVAPATLPMVTHQCLASAMRQHGDLHSPLCTARRPGQHHCLS